LPESDAKLGNLPEKKNAVHRGGLAMSETGSVSLESYCVGKQGAFDVFSRDVYSGIGKGRPCTPYGAGNVEAGFGLENTRTSKVSRWVLFSTNSFTNFVNGLVTCGSFANTVMAFRTKPIREGYTQSKSSR
jgi:hypothetical protein